MAKMNFKMTGQPTLERLLVVADEAELDGEVPEGRRAELLAALVAHARVFVANADFVLLFLEGVRDQKERHFGVLHGVGHALDELDEGENDRVEELDHAVRKGVPLVDPAAGAGRHPDEEVPLAQLEEVPRQRRAERAHEAREEVDHVVVVVLHVRADELHVPGQRTC